jgi:hypothetical protein
MATMTAFPLASDPLVPVLIVAGGLFVLFWAFAAALVVRDEVMLRMQSRSAARAALEAAADDPAFDPDGLRSRAVELWNAVQSAHADGDLDRLAAEKVVAPPLLTALRREAAFVGERQWLELMPEETLRAWLLGIVNRDEDRNDRAVVHLKCFGKRMPEEQVEYFEEYYVLGRRDDGAWWVADRMDVDEGLDFKDAHFILQEADDIERLRDASLQELASDDAIGARIVELSSSAYRDDPVAIARDLSLLDGRYDQAVIEAAVRTVLRAWENVRIDEGTDLKLVSTGDAVKELMGQGAQLRLLRNVTFRKAAPAGFAEQAQPPRMDVSIEYDARMRRENVPLADLTENDIRRHRWTATWTLELCEEPGRPWRLAACPALTQGINILR